MLSLCVGSGRPGRSSAPGRVAGVTMSVHRIGAEGHDRDTAATSRDTVVSDVTTLAGPDGNESPPLLRSALEQLHLEGAIFFRSELTEAFAFESTPTALADALHPGAERVIIFHIVARGRCWVAATDGDRHWAEPGDVIVLPYGDQHTIGGQPRPRACRSTRCSIRCRGPTCRPSATGAAATRSTSSAGYLYSDDPLFDPALRALPPAFVVRPPDGPDRRLGAGQHQLRARGGHADQRQRQPGHHPAARAGADRGPPPAPRHRARRRPRVDRRAARPGPGSRPLAHARRPRPEVDGGRAGVGCRGVPLAARRALPAGARALPDPLPDRVAHAPRRGAARHRRPGRRCGGPPGRLRVRGGVQPRLQADPRRGAQRVAGRPRTPTENAEQPRPCRFRRRAGPSGSPPAVVPRRPGPGTRFTGSGEGARSTESAERTTWEVVPWSIESAEPTTWLDSGATRVAGSDVVESESMRDGEEHDDRERSQRGDGGEEPTGNEESDWDGAEMVVAMGMPPGRFDVAHGPLIASNRLSPRHTERRRASRRDYSSRSLASSSTDRMGGCAVRFERGVALPLSRTAPDGDREPGVDRRGRAGPRIAGRLGRHHDGQPGQRVDQPVPPGPGRRGGAGVGCVGRAQQPGSGDAPPGGPRGAAPSAAAGRPGRRWCFRRRRTPRRRSRPPSRAGPPRRRARGRRPLRRRRPRIPTAGCWSSCERAGRVDDRRRARAEPVHASGRG